MIVKSMDALALKPDIGANAKEKTAARIDSKTGAVDDKTVFQTNGMERAERELSEKMVIEAIERANRAISGANRRFEYSFHDKTNEVIVKVIDSETNEVIREIPPKKILDLVASLMEMAGIIVDERR